MGNITFTKEGAIFVLEALGYTTNEEGYVINSTSKERTLDLGKKPFKPEQIICLSKDGFATSYQQIFELVVSTREPGDTNY